MRRRITIIMLTLTPLLKEQMAEVKEYARSLGFKAEYSPNHCILSFTPENPPVNANMKVSVLYNEVSYDDGEGYNKIANVDVTLRHFDIKKPTELAEFIRLSGTCYMILNKILSYAKE